MLYAVQQVQQVHFPTDITSADSAQTRDGKLAAHTLCVFQKLREQSCSRAAAAARAT